MTKTYPILVLWAVLALISCSKEPPAPVVPPEAAFVYTWDGQTYSTIGIAFKESVPRGLKFHSKPIPVIVNGVRYQDRLLVLFSDTGSGQYPLHTLQLYRTDERDQSLRISEFTTNATATVTQKVAETWSGTFAGESTNAQGQVVSTLSNGTFDHIQLL